MFATYGVRSTRLTDKQAGSPQATELLYIANIYADKIAGNRFYSINLNCDH